MRTDGVYILPKPPAETERCSRPGRVLESDSLIPEGLGQE